MRPTSSSSSFFLCSKCTSMRVWSSRRSFSIRLRWMSCLPPSERKRDYKEWTVCPSNISEGHCRLFMLSKLLHLKEWHSLAIVVDMKDYGEHTNSCKKDYEWLRKYSHQNPLSLPRGFLEELTVEPLAFVWESTDQERRILLNWSVLLGITIPPPQL